MDVIILRLILKFEPTKHVDYHEIDKYSLQGFIYSLIKETLKYDKLHETQGFKFFNFSNIFPINDFEKNTLKKLIISSPNDDLIKSMHETLNNKASFKLKNHEMELLKTNILKKQNCEKFISATPIVLYEDNINNRYYSFKQNGDFNFRGVR